MATRLYLHIGHAHAGTDHISSLLSQHSTRLRALGYGVFEDVDGVLSSLQEGAEHDGRAAAFFAAIETRAKREGLKAVVLSAPALGTPKGAALAAAAKAYFDCRIVYYFNRQDDQIVAEWAAGLYKTGIGLREYAERQFGGPRQLYRRTLEAYLAHFQASEMLVRLIWPPVMPGRSLSLDVWQSLDLADAGLPDTPVSSPLIDPDLADVLKESAYLFSGEDDHDLADFVARYHQSNGPVKANPLGPALRRRIMRHFQPENRFIKITFFADIKMPGWNAVPDSDDRTHDVTIGGIMEMLNLNLALLKDLREDVDGLKKRMGLK